ncbi:hypothetical protein ACJJTC_004585 [Scirpophaga incertulas]
MDECPSGRLLFCKDRPTLWFSSLEAQFHINGITQEVTKYHFAISHLDMECIREVEDIIIQPPQTEPYSKLKNAIISRFSESYEEKVRRLLESEPIGDRKPSSFLRHLRSLAGPCFPEQLLKTIWLNRLPRHVQLILASRKEQTLEDLWDLADQLMEITSHTPPAPVTFEVSSSQAAAPTAADFQDLNRKVEELTRAVAALTAAGPSGGAHHFHCHGTSRRRNRSHSRSRSRSGICSCVEADFAALAQSQQDDEELAEIRNSSSLKLEEIPIPGTSTNLLCDTSSGRPRLYLTPPFRRAAFDLPLHPTDVTDFVARLKSKMSELRLVPASNHSKPFSFVFKDLATATHVFLRDDTVRRSLQPPYSGPHCVLSRTDKTITLDLGGRQITVSIDRVKPAHIDIGSQVGTSQSSSPSPPGVTHSSPAPHPATLPASATTPLADPVITSPSSSTFPFVAHQPSTTLTSTSSVPTSPPLRTSPCHN